MSFIPSTPGDRAGFFIEFCYFRGKAQNPALVQTTCISWSNSRQASWMLSRVPQTILMSLSLFTALLLLFFTSTVLLDACGVLSFRLSSQTRKGTWAISKPPLLFMATPPSLDLIRKGVSSSFIQEIRKVRADWHLILFICFNCSLTLPHKVRSFPAK